MKIKQYDIWLADLNPRFGTEPGKARPVVVVQTDFLNNEHPSTIICPVTSNIVDEAQLLRVHLKKNQLTKVSDVLVDQIRAIDNRRFVKYLSKLTMEQTTKLKANLKVVLDI